MCLFRVLDTASAVTPKLMIYLHVSSSESPYSEHGALEEVENEGGTETHTSEDGEFQLFHAYLKDNYFPSFQHVTNPDIFWLQSAT